MNTITKVDKALDRAIELGVNVRKQDAGDVLDEGDYVEIGSRDGRPWHVRIGPDTVHLEELGRNGYTETIGA